MSHVDQVLTRLFGRTTRAVISQSTLSVGNTAAQVVRQNPNRLLLIFVNTSASDIFISPIETVTPNYGILIPASGGSITLSVQNDFALPSLQWSAISTASAANLLIIEQQANNDQPEANS